MGQFIETCLIKTSLKFHLKFPVTVSQLLNTSWV